MYRILSILVLTLVSCNSNRNIITNKNVSLKNSEFIFSDNGLRSLKIKFIQDTLIEVSNNVSKDHAHNYHLFNFKNKYIVDDAIINRLVIKKSLDNINEVQITNYIKPFRKKIFKSKSDIFPNLVGDTIYFTNDFRKLLIKDFTFEMN